MFVREMVRDDNDSDLPWDGWVCLRIAIAIAAAAVVAVAARAVRDLCRLPLVLTNWWEVRTEVAFFLPRATINEAKKE